MFLISLYNTFLLLRIKQCHLHIAGQKYCQLCCFCPALCSNCCHEDVQLVLDTCNVHHYNHGHVDEVVFWMMKHLRGKM